MLADRIDGALLAELAQRRGTRSGQLDPRNLPRLAKLLDDSGKAALEVAARFAPANEGLARLSLSLRGELQLVCQRCLQAMAWPVALDASLTVVADEAGAEALADPFDSVVMEDGALRLDRVAEDEVLAAVPLAPRHESREQCSALPVAEDEQQDEVSGTSRPFAALGAMMKADRQRTN